MIRASSIYYTVVLSALMAIVLGSMVALSGMNKLLEQKIRIPQILMQNAYSGLAYAEVFHHELEPGLPLEISLFDGVLDSVELAKKNWGAFTVLISEAHHRNQSCKVFSLCGQRPDDNQPNFYVVDNGRTISVCGNTLLEGDCYLPSSGTKRAYIGGKNFTGTNLIAGRELRSSRNLPEVNMLLYNSILTPIGTIRPWSDHGSISEDSIHQTFSDLPLILIGDQVISTSGMNISGQVWIEADSVFIAMDSSVDGIVVKARAVSIESGFSGRLQIFAGEKIYVGTGAVLLYPSVLGMIENSTNDGAKTELIIDSAAKVLGSVFVLTEKNDFRNLPELTIETDALVHGLAYCQGKTQLKGTVNGSLYTEKFFLETPASSYENYILDGRVLDRLPQEFVCVDLLRDDSNEEPMPLTRIDFLK